MFKNCKFIMRITKMRMHNISESSAITVSQTLTTTGVLYALDRSKSCWYNERRHVRLMTGANVYRSYQHHICKLVLHCSTETD